MNVHTSANAAWYARLWSLLNDDDVLETAPRGLKIREQLHATVRVDMRRALVLLPQRKLSHRFAAAEALWIINADDRLQTLLPYAKRMAEFSDDGVTLAGAYGPRLEGQIDYVVQSLLKDRDTRQAVQVIWRPNPKPSKDIPCTLALSFMIRAGLLHVQVFMRSSDVWLGLPYDLFSFSCYGQHVMHQVNLQLMRDRRIGAGDLYLTAASSHLYDTNRDAARAVLELPISEALRMAQVLPQPLQARSNEELMDLLQEMRDAS